MSASDLIAKKKFDAETNGVVVMIVFNGTNSDFWAMDRIIKDRYKMYNHKYFRTVGVFDERSMESLVGLRTVEVVKTDTADFWLWAKCVEVFRGRVCWPEHDYPYYCESEIVPCQFG